MINVLVLLSELILSKADYKSYEGVNCGYVYDGDKESIYPLGVCITDYDEDALHPYQSRQYICSQTNGDDEIDVYTYYGTECEGTADESRSALGSDNDIYDCGDSTGTYDECYLEYRVHSECEEWVNSSYTSEYVIVGACVDGVDGIHNQYSRCTNDTVEYVRFNDEECCDLSYVYTSHDGPQWKSYDDIVIGCNDNVYIDADSWSCLIPDGARDEDVFTDNMSDECNDANALNVNWIIGMAFFGVLLKLL